MRTAFDTYEETAADGEARGVALDHATAQLRQRVFDQAGAPRLGALRRAFEDNAVCVGCGRRIRAVADAMLFRFLDDRVAHVACFTRVVDTHDHPLLRRARPAATTDGGAGQAPSAPRGAPGLSPSPTGTSAGAGGEGQPASTRHHQ